MATAISDSLHTKDIAQAWYVLLKLLPLLQNKLPKTATAISDCLHTKDVYREEKPLPELPDLILMQPIEMGQFGPVISDLGYFGMI